MIVDKNYCMSSFLMYRTIADHRRTFKEDIVPQFFTPNQNRVPIHNSTELFEALRKQVVHACKHSNTALALSGGIDSAILAKLMPKGSKAYTFRCVVPGIEVTNEVPQAAKYAEECGLEHEVIEIYWEDFEKYAPILMQHKGAPIHSIEVQIYKAALKAKEERISQLIFGESADCVFGGLSNILSREWSFDDFVTRYQYVSPRKTLIEPVAVLEPIMRHEKDGMVDPHDFMSTEFYVESMGSYDNASKTAGVSVIAPYANCYMAVPLDYERVRSGENKYLVREVFNRLYPGFIAPPKTPMPRPMNEWLANWEGPKRTEFLSNNNWSELSGDQKWLIWALEKYLNLIEKN